MVHGPLETAIFKSHSCCFVEMKKIKASFLDLTSLFGSPGRMLQVIDTGSMQTFISHLESTVSDWLVRLPVWQALSSCFAPSVLHFSTCLPLVTCQEPFQEGHCLCFQTASHHRVVFPGSCTDLHYPTITSA